ncbi:MAG TPA: peptidoglycan-associated lipoprotein Pal [Verrucomicrobiae bacterium]|nr:peptidoglycan-associated lipoprotein Pal [Verrucomicrobiae bacterium]
MKHTLQLLTIASLMLAAACSSDKTRTDEDGSGSSSSGTAGSSGGPVAGTGSGGIVGGPTSTGRGGKAGLPSSNVLYFEFDSSDLKPEGASLADAWAKYLAANPNAKVRLEGHTDERGTREYNVGLGERRGNSVLQALTSRGVAERQVTVSSFGEERPESSGHDESAWSQNRRVEIVQ